MRLDGKVALVTGGASGIGAETARLFAREGAKVAVGDLDGEAALGVAEAIAADGGEALAVTLDVTRSAEVQAAVGKTVQRFGRLDVLFNSAGIFIEGGAVDQTEDDWDKVMAVNVKGTFLACKHAIPKMLEGGGGAIVNVGSIQSFSGDSAGIAYTASKAAILTLTRNIALQFAAQGIRCNTVCPGDCETPLIAALFERNPGMRDGIAAKYPAGKLARPIDIANAVLFLASDEAAFATGTELVVDGGFLAK